MKNETKVKIEEDRLRLENIPLSVGNRIKFFIISLIPLPVTFNLNLNGEGFMEELNKRIDELEDKVGG